jgi:hypothetical protein
LCRLLVCFAIDCLIPLSQSLDHDRFDTSTRDSLFSISVLTVLVELLCCVVLCCVVLCCAVMCCAVMIHVPFIHFLDYVLLDFRDQAQIFSEVPSSILENCS